MRSAILLLLLARLATAQPSLLRPSDAAPGSWLSLSGFRLSPTERAWQSSDFNGAALPLALDGVSVKINGKSAAIAYISANRIDLLVPADAGDGDVPLLLTTPSGPVPPASVSLRPVAPRWLGSLVRPNGTTVHAQNPAEIGETVSMFGTGFGPTSAAIDPMTLFSGAEPLARPQDLGITMGGREVQIIFAGLVANGLYQFNFVIPPLPENGANDLIATVGEFRTPQFSSVAIITPGPPVIHSISPSDFIWGQRSAVVLQGTGLLGTNTITISDPSQLTFPTGPAEGPFFPLAVQENAAPGTRTLTVTTARGTSNAIPLTIRRGSPTITSLTPITVHPGRIQSFTITGTDLVGVTTIEVTPAAGIRTLNATNPPPAGGLAGTLQIDDAVPPGKLSVRTLSPWAASPAVELEVVPAPPTAPAIRALTDINIRTYNANIQGAFSGRADYTGEFEFTDTDGDSQTGSRAEMLIERGDSMTSIPGKIELLSKPGTAKFTFTTFTRSRMQGPFPVWITLIDDAGNRSNALKGSIDALYF